MSYFIRFTHNPTADLERGYSFIGYTLDNSREEAFETLAQNEGVFYDDGFDMEAFMRDNDDRIAQDNVTGMWGTRRSGLCGYGEYNTVEAALADSANLSDQYRGMKYMVVCEGELVHDERDGQDGGVCFIPVAIIQEIVSAQ